MMIQGTGDLGRMPPWRRRRPRVVAVNNAEISAAYSLLSSLAERQRGGPLTLWQRRRLRRLASRVAIRRKAGAKPTLSRAQAMQLYNIIYV